jgi:hypothetical protein
MPLVDAIYAWIATEHDGGEGVCATRLGDHWWPLIGADEVRIESLRPAARAIMQASGCPVRLVRFDRRTVLADAP